MLVWTHNSETKFPYQVYDQSLYPKLYSLSCTLWPQACASWTLINKSQMTKTAIADIIKQLKLLLWTWSLTYKLRLLLQHKMSGPRATDHYGCRIVNQRRPDFPKPQIRNVTVTSQDKQVPASFLPVKQNPNSKTRCVWNPYFAANSHCQEFRFQYCGHRSPLLCFSFYYI